jgi:hypothetical protein
MERKDQKKVQKTLDFIQKDRIIPDDPWFYSRLIGRIEKEAERTPNLGFAGAVTLRLRLILAVLVLMVGIAGGISLGKVISTPSSSNESTTSIFPQEEDANAAFFSEINSSIYEQILLMK